MKISYETPQHGPMISSEIDLDKIEIEFEENMGEPQKMPLDDFLYSLMKRIRDLEGRK
jgi:hypothetical protein